MQSRTMATSPASTLARSHSNPSHLGNVSPAPATLERANSLPSKLADATWQAEYAALKAEFAEAEEMRERVRRASEESRMQRAALANGIYDRHAAIILGSSPTQVTRDPASGPDANVPSMTCCTCALETRESVRANLGPRYSRASTHAAEKGRDVLLAHDSGEGGVASAGSPGVFLSPATRPAVRVPLSEYLQSKGLPPVRRDLASCVHSCHRCSQGTCQCLAGADSLEEGEGCVLQASIVPMRSGLLGSNVSGDGLQRLEELLMQWGEGRQQEKGSHEDWGQAMEGKSHDPRRQAADTSTAAGRSSSEPHEASAHTALPLRPPSPTTRGAREPDSEHHSCCSYEDHEDHTGPVVAAASRSSVLPSHQSTASCSEGTEGNLVEPDMDTATLPPQPDLPAPLCPLASPDERDGHTKRMPARESSSSGNSSTGRGAPQGSWLSRQLAQWPWIPLSSDSFLDWLPALPSSPLAQQPPLWRGSPTPDVADGAETRSKQLPDPLPECTVREWLGAAGACTCNEQDAFANSASVDVWRLVGEESMLEALTQLGRPDAAESAATGADAVARAGTAGVTGRAAATATGTPRTRCYLSV